MPLFMAAVWSVLRRHRRQVSQPIYPSPPLAVMLWEDAWLFGKRWSPVVFGGVAAGGVLIGFASSTPGPVLHLAVRGVAAALAFALAWTLTARHRGAHR